jgi:hypothetical protein
MKAPTKDALLLADMVRARFLDHDLLRGASHSLKEVPERVIAGMLELEKAGLDWISAVRSPRFVEGHETVGRILAYPGEPGKSSETRRLLKRLGLDKGDFADGYSLLCGVTFFGIVEEEVARLAWIAAAELAEEIAARNRAASLEPVE